MSDSNDDLLIELLEGNAAHVDGLPDDYFASVQDGQRPDVVSICCSDSRVPQERMWNVDAPGDVFTPSNIGNQAQDEHDGDRIVDGGLLYPIHHAGTEAVAVVGHTGCGAVTAAYNVATGGDLPGPDGVDKWVSQLVPIVEEGLESDLVETDQADESVINQLVEYNVDSQVQFLQNAAEIPDEVAIYGFVYDFQGIYGEQAGRTYLVNHNGETEPGRIAAKIPAEFESATRSILY
ncbi:carbonic anhydrase [Halostagnicola larsenii XH-48]|uniref:carbonic anhydrase n=1 Tax=Halostagnicola larsenii XH-48 TaxID=797299 RepID=W0JMP6_9EURY|nr:carbonic anhydrase [Halostagnicola larsenii]AHF98434.1 carbonic anhydrase [Halostagnicola larsenii XH-48]